jgi:chromosome partitioning protein
LQIRNAASARARWQPIWPEAWRGVTHVVLDTPVGIDTTRLHRAMRIADRVIVPLQPSMFDILATQAFLQQLSHYVGQLCMPVLGFLRDTQNDVQLAAMGSTLRDVAPSRVERDIAQWQDLLHWIDE